MFPFYQFNHLGIQFDRIDGSGVVVKRVEYLTATTCTQDEHAWSYMLRPRGGIVQVSQFRQVTIEIGDCRHPVSIRE